MYDLLVKDALIVTCNPEHSVIDGAVMAVRDGKIALIAPAQSDAANALEAKNYMSAKGKMVLPGLINMHCHAGDSLFRGLVENLPLEAWLNRVWIAEKAILTPHTTYLGSVLGFAENLLSGVTSVMDMFWYPHEAVRAAQMLGMRVSTGGLFFDFPGIGERSHERYIEEAKEFSSRYSRSADVFPCVMPHGAYTVSPEHLRDAKSIADADRGLFCTHAAETRAEQADIQNRYGRTVIRHLD
ncbi:MAG: amidohydrolase family protein, partial [Paracoccaceae bacterium]